MCSSALPTPAVPVCPVAPCPQGIGPMRATRAGAKVRSAATQPAPVPRSAAAFQLPYMYQNIRFSYFRRSYDIP